MALQKYTADDAKWIQFGESDIFIGDVLHEGNSTSLGGGFAHFHPGTSMTWTPSYEEIIVVLSGAFTVESASGSVIAGPGEIVRVDSDAEVTFRAGAEKVVLAFATYPVWGGTDETKASASVLRPVSGPLPA
ncbi:hypothetical protein GZH49_23645 [Nocardia terpenica]|uniref:hypothetical protein n=1 Tax=Nocardia terpenica TaxID=455432 RepID=UPI002FE25A87